MIIMAKHYEVLKNALKCAIKVTNPKFNDHELKQWLHTINELNKLEPTVSMLGGNNVSDYVIDSVISDMVLPRTITLTGSTLEADFRDVSEVSDLDCGKIMSSAEFQNFGVALCGAFRKDPNWTTVQSLREVDGILSSYSDKQVVNGEVRAKEISFRPIKLTVTQYKQASYSWRAEDILTSWFIDSYLK